MLSAALSGAANAASAPADTVYVGDHIITFDTALPRAQSLATRGEQIVCVAADAACRAFVGPSTRVVELGARALLPGFIDAHGHVTMLAGFIDRVNLSSPPVGAVTNIATLQQALRTQLKDRSREWIVGWGYDDSLLVELRHPTRDDLDAVSSDTPILILHVSGHLAVANSAALAAGGITAATADPPGGHFRRRDHGNEPNGVAEEAAIGALVGRTPIMTPVTADALRRALDVYASFGFTTVQDGASAPADVAALERLAQAGTAPLDVVFYPRIVDVAQKLPEVPLHEYHNRIAFGGVKLILDGSPQGKTAFLSQPYLVPPSGQSADYRGYPIFPQQFVDAALARFLPAGIALLAHANGDAAAQMLIEAVAKAVAVAPTIDHRTVMIHAQTVREDQLDRIHELHMIPSFFSAHTFYWGDWHRDSVLGKERAYRISPTHSALQRAIPFTIHNDAPVVPPDSIRLLWATVNRISRSGDVIGPDQRIGIEDALRALTVNGAYQYFEEKRKGSLTVGKQADLVTLSRDPLAMAPQALLELVVVETTARGSVVFQRDR